MKKPLLNLALLFCFLLLASVNIARGQGHIAQSAEPRDVDKKVAIDDVKLRVVYRARISTDTLGKGFYFDNQALEVGERHTRFYSLFAEDIDSVKWRVHNDPKRVKSSQGGAYQPRENLARDEYGTYEDIFMNYPNESEITIYTGYHKNFYVYQEPIPIFEWEFTQQKVTILGYECIEATTSFRGRDYRVWFTVDVPYNYGPWKFSGLPGIILKAEDTKGLFKWEAIGIEQPKEAKIYRYDIVAKKCSRKDVLKLNDLRWKNQQTLALTNGIKSYNAVVRDPKTGKLVEVEMPQLEPIPQLELF